MLTYLIIGCLVGMNLSYYQIISWYVLTLLSDA